MRILVMFDLPVITDTDRREYRKFRKFLILNGFLMLQESVYCKIAQNSVVADGIVENEIPKEQTDRATRTISKEDEKEPEM